MTTAHVAVLYFEGRREMAKKRLQRIKAAGYVAERPRSPFATAILILTVKGISALRERGILREYPALNQAALVKRAQVSDLTIRHELEVMDVKTAFYAAIKQIDVSVLEFTTWPLLHQFASRAENGCGMVVKPDAFVRLTARKPNEVTPEHAFFVELDRSTETQAMLVSRASRYAEHYRSGNYAHRNGGTRVEYRKFPFRVLYILKTAERRNNTSELLLHCDPPILAHVWLTTFEEITREPFGAIWIRPIDYRDGLEGSPFDPTPRPLQSKYKRQAPRDMFVEQIVLKRRLIDG
jgi:hypothetical protein